MPKRILIFDDPKSDLKELHQAFELATKGRSRIVIERDEQRIVTQMATNWELIVLDYGDANRTADDSTIKAIHQQDAETPIVVIVPADGQSADEYLEAGAIDYLLYGPDFARLLHAQMQKIGRWIDIIEKNRALHAANIDLRNRAFQRFQMVGNSPQMTMVFRQIERVAKVPRPVLVCGERGTGKELVARAIHDEGGSANRPLVTVNCAAFTDELLASELFGHERGSFTGAASRHRGKFEQAHGGTLFLDEIGHMSLSFQKKILRVVEYGTFRRVGGSDEIKVKTRVIAATNADLKAKIVDGTFLSDLYDRLAFEVIQVPPLRDRSGDLTVLANFFMQRFMLEVPEFRGKYLSKSAQEVLANYSFPGNVRELKNIIERAVYRDTTNEITPIDIGFVAHHDEFVKGDNFKDKVSSFERMLVVEAMEKSGANQAAAARFLGLSYHQFRYYWQKYGPSGSEDAAP